MTHDLAAGENECYVAVKVVSGKCGRHDETGTLYVTDRKLVFVGESITDAPWSEIAKLSRKGATLLALRRDRQPSLVFVCASLFDSVLVAEVALRLASRPAFGEPIAPSRHSACEWPAMSVPFDSHLVTT